MDSERRKTFRAQLRTLVEATLVVGKQSYEVRVVDQSAGGMMVAASCHLPVVRDDLVQLRTRDSASEMRVARVEVRGMGMRVGLELVRELAPPKGAVSPPEGSRTTQMYRWAGPSAVPVMVFGVLIVAATVMVTALRQAPPTNREISTWSSLFRQPPSNNDAPVAAVRLDAHVRRTVRNQEGLGIFNVPEVVAILKLSDLQQAELRTLLDQEQELLRSELQGAANSDMLTQIQLDALAVLNSDQRQQLRSILRESVSTLFLVDQMARSQWPRANARQLINRLGAAALTLPRVVDQLQLSPQQAAEIQRVVESALDDSQQLYEQARLSTHPEKLHEQATQRLDQALADAMRWLSPEQRQKLEAMRE